MGLTVGIIGLPQSGKTTLFNALTRAGAQISGYPTSTVQANRAVVEVPDARLGRLAEIFHPRKVVPTTVEFVDVAGLGQATDTAKREGLSAEFLGHIRNADALAIVVRCFNNPAAPHPAGSIDARRDVDDLMAELVLTDLATVEKRTDSTGRKAKSGDKRLQEELEFLRRLRAFLNEGRPASGFTYSSLEEPILRELFLLTLKPRFYVVNVGEDALAAANTLLAGTGEPSGDELGCVAVVRERARAEGAEVAAVSAKLEAELGELPAEDAAEYLAALGLPELGADRVIQTGYAALNLISFLTAGEDEVRAWTVTRGSKAPTAAGKIHSDFERGFIRAEVVHYDDLMADGGSMKTAREHGHIRLEGKDYTVRDGDIIEFRFNVSR
ncbi:MAG TPA: redox-regulated ATPase YchF [Ktedonobacterales bacterium]|nr:redox-regulated ATPase YchF [Ktedonobacterales bacterium]